MSTYICPPTGADIWFPLDPAVVELPEAPATTINPAPVPANTYTGAVTETDFVLEQEEYGSLAGVSCTSLDYGLITATVISTGDYGNLQTLWDLLPTDAPAVPVEVISFSTLYPPYHESVAQVFAVVISAEVQRISRTQVALDISPLVVRVAARVYKPRIIVVTAVLRVRAECVELGGAVPLVIRTVISLAKSDAPARFGFITDLIAWGDGETPVDPIQLIDAPLFLRINVQRSDTDVIATVRVRATVEQQEPVLGMIFGFEVT